MKTIATCLALLCSLTAALRADTVLIYDTASTTRSYGNGTTGSQTTRFYLLFNYTTLKTGFVGYSVVKGKKHYYLGAFAADNFLRASARTSATASATFISIISDDAFGAGRQVSCIFISGANKLMDLGGGHTGNFPPKAIGVIRGLARDPGLGDGAIVGNIALRLVPTLTTASNTANATLEASIQIVVADLERRGYTKP